MVASLILAGLGFRSIFVQTRGLEDDESRGSNGVHDHSSGVF
jgi:hypothetical protein